MWRISPQKWCVCPNIYATDKQRTLASGKYRNEQAQNIMESLYIYNAWVYTWCARLKLRVRMHCVLNALDIWPVNKQSLGLLLYDAVLTLCFYLSCHVNNRLARCQGESVFNVCLKIWLCCRWWLSLRFILCLVWDVNVCMSVKQTSITHGIMCVCCRVSSLNNAIYNVPAVASRITGNVLSKL